MPITSTQVSNIIGGQIGMFSASAQYSQAISAQYGFAPSGAPFGAHDPMAAGNIQRGGAMGSAMAGAPTMAMGALSTAAMFGAAPRIFDPFSMSMHMGARGFAAGGLAGGIGMGAATFGAYGAMGGMGSWAVDQMRTGAQNRMMVTGAASQMMPGMRMGGLNAIAGQVESMNRQGMGSISELTGLMRQGANSGALNTSTLSEFTMSFQKLVSNVRQVATALNTTMQQAQQAMQQVKAIGISSDSAAGFLGTARAFGSQVGMGPQQMMRYASAGSTFAAGAGIDRQTGAQGAITQAGVYGLANRQNLPGILPDSYQRYMGGATRFLGSSQGRSVLGAMLDVNTGGLNMNVARQINAGNMSRQQIQSLSRRNISEFGRDAFSVRQGELGASFISEFGPQGMGAAIGEMSSGSSRPERLQQMLTGLNRSDLAGMNMLQQQSGRLTNQLVGAARAGFREGQQQQNFSGALKQSWDQLIKPVRDQFRAIGSNMTRSMQTAMEEFTGEFVRSNQFQAPSYAAQRSGINRQWRAAQFGDPMLDAHRQMTSGGAMGRDFQYAPSGGDGGFLSTIANRLPSGMRIGAYAPGTTLGELPGFGLGTEQYSGMQTIGAFGMRPGGHVLGAMGRGIYGAGGVGAGFMNTVAPSSGPAGMGGRGWIGGTGMGLARSTQAAGLLARGTGALARGLGPLAVAGDLATNAMPEAMRRHGFSSVTAGAITGNQRRGVQFMMDTGVLEEGHDYEEMPVADFMALSEGAKSGLTPLGGFSAAPTGSGGGRQLFLTNSGRERIRALGTPDARAAAAARFGTNDEIRTGATVDAQARVADAARYVSTEAGSGWDDLSGPERIERITERLRSEGNESVRTSDVVAHIQGVTANNRPVISDESLGIMQNRYQNPDNVRRSQGMAQSREMYLALANAGDSSSQTNRETGFDIGRLDQNSTQEMIEALDSVHGRAGWFNPNVTDSTTNAAGITSDMTAQQIAQVLKAPGTNTRDVFSLIHNLGGNQGAHSNFAQGRAARASTDSALGAGAGARVYGNNASADSSTQLSSAWQAGMGAAITNNPAASAELHTLQQQLAQTSDPAVRRDIIHRIQRSMGAYSNDPAIQDAMSIDTGVGEGYTASFSDWERIGEDYRITAAEGLEDIQGIRLARDASANRFDSNRQSILRGAREASEMSGGSWRYTNRLKQAAERYHTGRGSSTRAGRGREGRSLEYSEDWHIAGRQDFMDTIQIRLRGSAPDAEPEDRRAAIDAGGIMDMDDFSRLSAELLEEDDAGLRDLGQVAAQAGRYRRAFRTRGGMGKGRDQVTVAEALGIRFTGSSATNDRAFLRNEDGGVMSMQLEGQLRTMARDALRATSPDGQEVTNSQIETRMGQMMSAIRSGQDDGYETLTRLLSTQGAPSNPNASANAPGGAGNTSQLSAQNAALAGEVQTLISTIRSINTQTSGG